MLLYPKEDYPILNNCTYLNTARSGILSKSLKKWRAEHDDWFLKEGSKFRKNQEDFLSGVRHTIASLFDAVRDRVVLVPNVSIGINIFLDRLPQQMSVLMIEDDYPSINNAIEARNFNPYYVSLADNLEEVIYEAIKTNSPDMLAVSWVHYKTGIKIEKDFFKTLKSDFPELLIVVDGTQYCGTAPVHFDFSGIDVLGASGYKWLSAGYGNGFMLYSEKAIDLLSIHDVTKMSATYKQYESLLQFYNQPGHLDTMNFGSLQFAIRQLRYNEEPVIYNKIKTLSSLAKSCFSEKGLLDDIVMKRKSHSSIFLIKGGEKLYYKLEENRILTSLWQDKVRVSFHYYNTEEDLNSLLKFL